MTTPGERASPPAFIGEPFLGMTPSEYSAVIERLGCLGVDTSLVEVPTSSSLRPETPVTRQKFHLTLKEEYTEAEKQQFIESVTLDDKTTPIVTTQAIRQFVKSALESGRLPHTLSTFLTSVVREAYGGALPDKSKQTRTVQVAPDVFYVIRDSRLHLVETLLPAVRGIWGVKVAAFVSIVRRAEEGKVELPNFSRRSNVTRLIIGHYTQVIADLDQTERASQS